MLLSGDLVDAPYLLFSVCALYMRPLLLLLQVLSISSPVSLSIKYSIITFVT